MARQTRVQPSNGNPLDQGDVTMSEVKYHEVFDLSEGELYCGLCHVPLENGPITLRYMGNDFPILMPKCPLCGLGLIPEELATGKISDVERALEDK